MSRVQNSMCPDHLASEKPAKLNLFSLQNRNEDMSGISMDGGLLRSSITKYYGSCIGINFNYNS